MDKKSKIEKATFCCAKLGILLFAMAAVMNIMLGLRIEEADALGIFSGIGAPLPKSVFYVSAYVILFMLVGFLSSECLRWLYASSIFHGAAMLAVLAPSLYLFGTFLLWRLHGDGAAFVTAESLQAAMLWMNRFHFSATILAIFTAIAVVPVAEFMRRDT